MRVMCGLYTAVRRELESLDSLLWLTPYMGERKALLEQLRRHLEAGDPELAPEAPAEKGGAG
jgi:hypothetical protein